MTLHTHPGITVIKRGRGRYRVCDFYDTKTLVAHVRYSFLRKLWMVEKDTKPVGSKADYEEAIFLAYSMVNVK